MFKNIKVHLVTGGEKELGLLATATTAIRYKQVFGSELMPSLTSIIESAGLANIATLLNSNAAEGADGDTKVEDLKPEELQVLIRVVGSGGLSTIPQLAYVMAKAAEGANMKTLNFDDYVDWLDGFDSMELELHAMEIIEVYLGNRITSVDPKKEAAQLIES